MHGERRTDRERTSRIGLAALGAAAAALLAAAAIGTYQASSVKARAVREVPPEGAPSATQYLPGSTSQIGAVPVPLMNARRAALRDGFDREDAPIDAFDRLRTIPGHEEEARALLAQFWGRKAMVAGDPVRRVLYALQARVVADDDSTRRAAASAIAALGPLRRAQHVEAGASDGCAPPAGANPPREPPAEHRRGKGAVGAPLSKRLPAHKAGEVHVEACAAQTSRCVLRDATGVGSIWDFGGPRPRLLFEGVGCEVKRLSPSGTRAMCGPTQDGATLYSEDEAGQWTRSNFILPALADVYVHDDGTVCGSPPGRRPNAVDGADVLFFAPYACWGPPAMQRTWGSIRMLPDGAGAVFRFPPTAQGAPGSTEFFGFNARGESLASASNAWFGPRRGERLLEYDATSSTGHKTYELGDAPFDPAAALADAKDASSVQVEQAFFVDAPASRVVDTSEPSLVLQLGFATSGGSAALHAVARWALKGPRLCGPAIPGAIESVAPTGDAAVIDGRVFRLGACAPDRAFEATETTEAVAVGPGAQPWIARVGDAYELHASNRDARPVPVAPAEKGKELQFAFNAAGDRFFVRTGDSLCRWSVHEDGTLDLDGCRWSTGGWVSDAAWASGDRAGEAVLVFDRTAEGAALREFFGGRESEPSAEVGGDLACTGLPKPSDPPLAVLDAWEERLGHRFRDQAAPLADARETASSEIVPTDMPLR